VVASIPFRLLGLLTAGIVGALLVVGASGLDPKRLVGLAGAGMIVATMIVTGRPREVLLASYIVSLSYNRQYYAFDHLFGTTGAQGMYWLPSDPVLLLLFLSPLVTPRQARAPVAGNGSVTATLMPVLPFLAACAMSTLLASRPDWAMTDLVRVVKFTLLLIWLHTNMTRSLWLTAVFSFAAVVGLQSILGVMQVVLKTQASLLATVGLASQVQNVANDIENRARGTFGHPNLLAPYLLMVVPAIFGAALFTRDRLLALGGYMVTGLGLVGVIASKSRAPIALMAVGLIMVSIVAVRLRALSVRRAIGVTVLALGIASAATVPFIQDILDRLQGDFGSSVEFRSEYNRAGLGIWNDHPLIGIGPNNVNLELGRHAPGLAALITDTEQFRDLGNVRSATIHNVYVLMLAETGVIGLAAFLFMLAAPLLRAFRAGRESHDAVRGACVGAGCGLIVGYAQQMVDFSLWYDSAWFSFAIIIGLISTARVMGVERPGLRR